jgi:hypothetical protein
VIFTEDSFAVKFEYARKTKPPDQVGLVRRLAGQASEISQARKLAVAVVEHLILVKHSR